MNFGAPSEETPLIADLDEATSGWAEKNGAEYQRLSGLSVADLRSELGANASLGNLRNRLILALIEEKSS